MKKVILIAILVMFVSGFGFAITPAQRITEDCGIYIEASHMNQLFDQLEIYAKIFGMPMQRGQIKQLIAMNIFNKQSIPGINISKKLALFLIFKNASSTPQFVLMLPVRNWNSYRTHILPKIKLSPNSINKKLGNYSIIASSEMGMRRFNESPRLENAKIFRKAQLNFFVNFKILGSIIAKAMNNLQPKIKYDRNSGQNEKAGAQLLDYYTNMIKSIMNLTAGLKLDHRGLEINYNVKIDPNSEIGRLMTKTKDGKLKTLAFLPKNAIAVTAGKMNMKAMLDSYENTIFSLMADNQDPEIKMAKELLQTIFSFSKLHFKDEMALAMLTTLGNNLSFVAVVKINDPDSALSRYKKLIRKLNSSKLFKKAEQEGGKITARLRKNIGTYSGISYHNISLNFKVKKQGRHNRDMKKMMKLMKSLFSVKLFHYRGYEIATFGTNNLTTIKKLIRVAKGKSRSFLKSIAYGKIRVSYGFRSKNGIFYLSLPKITKEFTQFASLFSKNRQLVQLSNLLKRVPLQGGGIYGYSTLKNNNSNGKIMISKQEIKSIFKIYMQFMKSKQPSTKRYNRHGR